MMFKKIVLAATLAISSVTAHAGWKVDEKNTSVASTSFINSNIEATYMITDVGGSALYFMGSFKPNFCKDEGVGDDGIVANMSVDEVPSKFKISCVTLFEGKPDLVFFHPVEKETESTILRRLSAGLSVNVDGQFLPAEGFKDVFIQILKNKVKELNGTNK